MNELMEFFTEPFQYPFMQRAIIAAVIIGIACAIFILLYGVKRLVTNGRCYFSRCFTWRGISLCHCNSFNDRGFSFGPILLICNRLFKRA